MTDSSSNKKRELPRYLGEGWEERQLPLNAQIARKAGPSGAGGAAVESSTA
jgi:hypothetical protein